MKRRFAALLATAGMLSTMGVLSHSAASANSPDVCVGQGTAAITNGTLLYPTELVHATNAGFSFNFATGACATKATLAAGGTVSGWCGLSSGWGRTNNDHRFAWVGAGSVLVLTGGVVGVVNAVPDVPNGESCLQPGADNFLVTGVAALPCNGQYGSTTTTPLLGFTVYTATC